MGRKRRTTGVVRKEMVPEDRSLLINPLMNDKVLRKVMLQLPEKHLFACRLVCKQWNARASEELSKSVYVYFDAEDYTDSLVGMRPFVTLMGRSVAPYITRVYLFDVELTSAVVMQFFHAYGKFIRELRLEYPGISRGRRVQKSTNKNVVFPKCNQWTVRDLRAILLSYVPNLESLELLGLPFVGRSEGIFDDWFRYQSTVSNGCIPEPMRFMDPKLRGNCCNLSSIRVEAPGRRPRKWNLIEDLIWMSDRIEKVQIGPGIATGSILMFLQNNARFGSLKTLVLDEITFPDVGCLEMATNHLNLTLERFEAKMHMSDITGVDIEEAQMLVDQSGFTYYFQALERFIQKQEETLKVLKLIPDPDCDMQPRLRGVDNVVELKMIPDQCDIEYFLHPFRNLKKLSLVGLSVSHADNTSWDLYFPKNMPDNELPKLDVLELPHGFQEVVIMKRIRKFFPTLKTLISKGIDDSYFLFELWTWRKLEGLHLELKVDFKEETDRIFTGFSQRLLKDSLLKPIGACKAASIANLQKLQYLEICLDPCLRYKRHSFGNTFILMGLLHMPKLRTLLMPKSKIDEKAIGLLHLENPLLTADFEHIEDIGRGWSED